MMATKSERCVALSVRIQSRQMVSYSRLVKERVDRDSKLNVYVALPDPPHPA